MSIPTTTQSLASSLVQFASKEHSESAARVTNITAQKITFEFVTNQDPFQVGDILSDSKILIGGDLAYEGNLIVLGVTQAGLLTHMEAQLEGEWFSQNEMDADFGDQMEADLEAHTIKWAADHDLHPSFRMVVADLRIYLEGLENWCNHVECSSLFGHPKKEEREAKLFQKVGPIVSQEIASHFADYEREVIALPAEARLAHREHLMREIHPFILQSPFSYRCYSKPLGYAGDYGMVDLMLGNSFQGESILAKLLNNAFLETGPVKAHQNRIDYLVGTIKTEVAERAAKGLRTRILNLGCGPALEVQRFIKEEAISETCDFTLLDFSDVTLQFTKGKIAEACTEARRDVSVDFIEESIQGFLKSASREGKYSKGSYDLVYCAGLFDYLQQRFCAKLTAVFFKIVTPGGLVAVTNVSEKNTIPAVMEDFLEWEIVHRSEKEMLELVPSGKSDLLKDLKSDSTRINIFLELRKTVANTSHVLAREKTKEASVKRFGVHGEIRSGRSRREGSQL